MNSTAYELFKSAALLIFTPHCFDNYFVDFNFFDGPCFTASLSKCLGLAIILGSLTVKLPQIIKIIKNKSGEGINLYSVTLDLTAITIYMAYSFVKEFPFSSWGDATFLGIQTLAVGVLVLVYSDCLTQAVSYLSIYCAICYVMMSGLTPINILWTLQTCNIPIVVAGKVVQAWTNYKNGNTGQLSAVTIFMLFAGSSARIFTSIQETGDLVVILTYAASTFANALLAVQMLYYWNSDKEKNE